LPNWKKVIVKGSDANLNSLVVNTNITSSNILISNDLDVTGDVDVDGHVLIGSADDTGHKLHVDGSIGASNLHLLSDGSITWAHGDVSIVEGTSEDYSLSFNTYDGSSNSRALWLQGNNNATFAGDVTATGIISGDYFEAQGYGELIGHSGGQVYLKDNKIGNGGLGISSAANHPITFWTGGSASFTSERMRITNDGNVGIGTDDPTGNLNIVDTATAAVNIEGSAVKLQLEAQGSTRATVGTTTSHPFRLVTSNTERLTIESGGNVGIGTTSPASILEINGGSADGVKIIAANAGTEFVLNASTSNGTSRLWVGGTGNVGIGTTSPSAKFHVNGTGVTSGTTSVLVENAIGDDIFEITDDGQIILREYNSVSPLKIISSITDITEPSIKIDSSKDSIIDLDRGSDIRRSYLGFSTAGTLNWVVGGASTAIGNGDEFYIGQHYSDAKLIILTGGNVGIGTTSPGEKLDVGGYIKSNIGFKALNYTTLLESGNNTVLSNTAYYNMLFKTNNAERMRITNAGDVGIGTTSPSAKLDVRGVGLFGDQTSSIAGSSHLQIARSNDPIMSFRHLNAASTGQSDYTNYYFKDTGGTERIGARISAYHATTHASQPGVELRFATTPDGGSLTERLTIDEDGNVGIGTTSPGQKLEVDGTVLINNQTGSSYLQIKNAQNYLGHSGSDFTLRTSESGVDLGISSNKGVSIHVDRGNAGSGAFSITTGGTSNTRFRVDNAGNVGIGTSSPIAKLEIQGANESNIFLRNSNTNDFESGRIRFIENITSFQGGFIHYDGSGNVFNIGVHNSGDELVSSDANAISILRSSGNVGIGTTAPGAKLEIAGTGNQKLLVNKWSNKTKRV